ncbi:thymidine phosphorylase [Coraliomargarita sp. SDUM461004]|uniref:thymidine phosphorylase n=1 Tax=Thalassobacterium sedimentorum TaxID=3041258 RepID=A0ABU1AGN8_9BACT|nr:thymidine phosphorylase [Coraliomargarita sp. SDUM461004]MDQ8193338.1 thymidine phosphorylase [Coraliomargarita sp. SDUM461004]
MKILPQEIIARKRDGLAFSRAEVDAFVAGVVSGDFKDYQSSALLMAIVLQGMSPQETAWLTEAMMRSGRVVELPEVTRPKVDKHSTGGVGDKVSLILAPLVAACGLCVPMMSGRGLGHTGGTLDKLESIPGFHTQLSDAAYRRQLQAIHLAMIGQSADMVPADRKLYALRDVTATVESIPLICSSILSKKMAEGIDALMEVTYALCAEMLLLGGMCSTLDGAMCVLRSAIQSGAALEVFRQLVQAQGGDSRVIDDYSLLPQSEHCREISFEMETTMYVSALDARNFGEAVCLLGGGRTSTDSVINPAVGLELLKKVGDRVQPQEPVVRVYYQDLESCEAAESRLRAAVHFAKCAPQALPLVVQRIASTTS